MKYYDMYITIIFIFKIVFIALAISHIYFKVKGDDKSSIDIKIEYWKERVEFVFIILIALLLIYLFSPTANRNMLLDRETKFLLYLFGFVLIITAKWENFFKESQ
jgi:heme/copper-type cytochrome/quinol oxidase subunit 2